ncbi:MAG: asparaginase [Emcibacter sp.]|nr:asparaginase [Emcibacter sp.]
MSQTNHNPILVEVTRGPLVESQHRGAVAVVNDRGEVVVSAGDIGRLIYPRSAVKPFQAMVAVETGAFAAFDLGDAELSLHCASHNGEERHGIQVEDWLEKIGLGIGDLECGVHMPFWISKNPGYSGAFAGACALHNNCSGKHAGFLTTARHMGGATADYIDPAHPVQQATIKLIAHMTGYAAEDMPVSMDACRAPVFGMPLERFAYGLARLGTQKGLEDRRAEAAMRVCRAMRAFPWNVAGTGRPETILMSDKAFSGIAKCGAEGIYALTLPDQGLGIAVKVDDGGDRAAHMVAMSVLDYLGVLNADAVVRLAGLTKTPIENWAGQEVGEVRPVEGVFLSSA